MKCLELNHKATVNYPINNFSIQKTFYNPGHFKSQIDKYDIEQNVFYTSGRYKDRFIGLKFFSANSVLFINIYSHDKLDETKINNIKNSLKITDFFVRNRISDEQLHELSTEILEKELLKIYGVGKQTVFYLLDGYFGRCEYLKHIPLWERKILSQYLFNKELCEEKYLVNWFKVRYGDWCGYALNEIFIDIFYQHKKKPFDWLSKIQRET